MNEIEAHVFDMQVRTLLNDQLDELLWVKLDRRLCIDLYLHAVEQLWRPSLYSRLGVQIRERAKNYE